VKNWKLGRRHLLTGVGTIFALPLLEKWAGKTARADTPVDPRRFLCMYMPNGTYNPTSDPAWQLPIGPLAKSIGASLPLSPFTAYQGDITVLSKLRQSVRDKTNDKLYQANVNGGGGGHSAASCSFLSGQIIGDPAATVCTIPGSSIDQLIGAKVGKPVIAVSGGAGANQPTDGSNFDCLSSVSFKNGDRVVPTTNPMTLYKNMFQNLVGGTPPPPRAAARNKSILDACRGDIAELKGGLGKNDNAKLDQYFTAVRALETSLAGPGGTLCAPIGPPSADLDNSDTSGTMQNYIPRMKSFMDMIALGFQCDIVRSASLMFDNESGGSRHLNAQVPSQLVYGSSDMTGDLHTGISHYSSNANGKAKCITRDRLYLSLVGYMIDKLKAAKDPSGSAVLDNTAIVAGFGVIDGSHDVGGSAGAPVMLVGGRNFFSPGQVIDASGYDLNDVYFTIGSALGLGATDYYGFKTVVKA
jgi:Protein of unknown function (DUF1552)